MLYPKGTNHGKYLAEGRLCYRVLPGSHNFYAQICTRCASGSTPHCGICLFLIVFLTMIIPVRCFTCGKVVGNKYETYTQMINNDVEERWVRLKHEPPALNECSRYISQPSHGRPWAEAILLPTNDPDTRGLDRTAVAVQE